MAVQDFFTWGAGGQKLTPDQLARRREIEDALLSKGVDFSPVADPLQGFARVANAAAGAFRRNRLGKAEGENAEINKGLIANLLAGGSGSVSPSSSASIPMSGAAGEIAATSPSGQPIDLSGNEVYSQFINTAREGGLTNPYGLAALAATGKAESGFSPGNVNRTWSDPSQSGQPGTAGGILSWRGPRYQALAATGDLSPAGQARFFLQEDPGLVQALNSAKSVEEAQGLINNAWKFAGYDRADGETARRLGLARSFLPTFQGGGEVAAATPEAAIEAIAPLQPVERAPLPEMSYAGQERAAPVSLSEEVASYQQTPEYAAAFPGRAQPAQVAAPVQVAGGGDRVPMTGNTGINPAIIEALTNPQASEQTQRIAGILLQQDQARQNAALDEQNWRARQAYEQELQANDPLRKLQIQKAQQDVERGQPLVNLGDGTAYDPNTRQFIKDPNATGKAPNLVELFDDKTGQPYKAQWNPQTKQFDRVGGMKAPSGTSLTVGPNGEVQFTQGGAKLTEAQSKDAFFTTRMTAATPTIDKFESSLMSLPEAAAGAIPMNLGRYAQSEEYQLAKDAGRDFVNAYLRKDSGAALTKQEEQNYGELLLPQPGDKPAILAAKRQRRAIAVEAIKSGMPAAALDGVIRAIQAVPGADQPAKTSDEVQTDIPGVKIRRKN